MAFFWAVLILGADSGLDSCFATGFDSGLGLGLPSSGFGPAALVCTEDPFPPFDPFPFSAFGPSAAWDSAALMVLLGKGFLDLACSDASSPKTSSRSPSSS